MAIPVIVKKDQLAYFIECLSTGKSIEAPPGGWGGYDMMALAGACFFARVSQGPMRHQMGFDVDSLPFEHREAMDETFQEDIHLAVEWYANAAELIKDGHYDEAFETVHKVWVYAKDGNRAIIPVEGLKSTPGGG